jgi:hypothetical protein
MQEDIIMPDYAVTTYHTSCPGTDCGLLRIVPQNKCVDKKESGFFTAIHR